MGAVLRFIGWVVTRGWKYGARLVTKIVEWARKNWRTVQRWIEGGVTFGTIVEWIIGFL